MPSGIALTLVNGPARLVGRLLADDPIVLLAFAAPVFAVVFAVAIIFLKKPLFFALGAESPPNTPAFSRGFVVQSATAVGATEFVAWLE